MESKNRDLLGQLTPANTTAASIFSPDKRDLFTIESIVICNTTGSAATYRLFLDKDGSTYSTATALAYDVSLPANSTTIFEVNMYMRDPAGNLAVRTGTADALTFTVFGDNGSV